MEHLDWMEGKASKATHLRLVTDLEYQVMTLFL